MLNVWLLCSLAFVRPILAQDPFPRWGQATFVINNALYIHGGKTDPSNSYGYSAAPTNNDLLRLSLSAPFSSSSPPWQTLVNSSISPTQGPSLSWHTLSAYDTSHVLLFGGLPGPNSPTVLVDLADSIYLLDLSQPMVPVWITEADSWVNQPVRRIYHASVTDAAGRVYIIGGEMADGSNRILSDHYLFQPTVPSFTVLPSENGPPDIVGHASVLLSDGRLLVFGGYSQSLGSFPSLSTIWVLNTSQSLPSWSLLQISSSSPLPAPRRSFAATSLSNGNVLIHGGTNTLQENFADGWILSTSQNVIQWKQIESLSQLGARRDHFAIPAGDLVLFDFGYLESSPAPSALQIYDCVKDTFLLTYTPPQHPISQPSSSQVPSTSTKTGPSSSTTPNAHPSNPPIPNGGASGKKHIAAAIGATLGLLALVLLVVGGMYYVRRRRSPTHGNNRFVALGQGDDSRSSFHFEGGPIALSLDNKRYRNGRPRWDSGLLNSLSSVIGGINRFSNVPERRDMLADEDTREFDRWHARSRQDRLSGSSWSLRSILQGQRVGTREPSMSSSLGMVTRREKTDSSADTAMLVGDHDGVYPMTPQVRLPRPQDMIYPKYPKYVDPFTDPIETLLDHGMDKDETMARPGQPYLHPLPRPFTTVQTVLPVSQARHALGTLPENSSQKTLPIYEHPQSDSSHASNHNTLVSDGSRSQLTSPPTSETPQPSPMASSSIIETRPLSQLVRRSDSWWTRFSRTSFLDRRPSNASRVSGGMSEFRDPKTPPTLIAINESTPIEDPMKPHLVSRTLSAVYENHNKSKTSVRTADTEAIERMARMADVQIVRSGSQRTTSTDTTSFHIHSRSYSRFQDSGQPEDTNSNPLDAPDIWQSPFHSPADDSDRNSNFSGFPHEHPSPILSHPQSPAIVPQQYSPTPSSSVATRICNPERRAPHAQGPLPPTNTKHWEEKVKQPGVSMTYGLTPRLSLFVANPDHTRSPSADS